MKKNELSPRQTWSAVGSMALCVSMLIAAEFMPVSLLTPIARDLRATEGMAGQAISISGLFAVVASPLKLIRSPYVLLVFSFLITQILVLFIPSHAGLGLLLMVTMYPILIRKGVSKLSALAVIGCCQFIDHGPGSGNEILAATTSKIHPATYFVHYQLPITIPVIIAVAVTHYLVQRWWDKREGFVAGALEHQHLDRAVAIGLIANCREPLIHREGEGIARLRAIERDPADAVAQFVEDVLGRVLGGLRLLFHFVSDSISFLLVIRGHSRCPTASLRSPMPRIHADVPHGLPGQARQ